MTSLEITVNAFSLIVTAVAIFYGAYIFRNKRNTPTRAPERAKQFIENTDYGVLKKIMKK